VKKSQNKPGEKEKPRRLTLSRETIQLLNDPSLLDLVKGLGVQTTTADNVFTDGTESSC
jgi:hypothetical protein